MYAIKAVAPFVVGYIRSMGDEGQYANAKSLTRLVHENEVLTTQFTKFVKDQAKKMTAELDATMFLKMNIVRAFA